MAIEILKPEVVQGFRDTYKTSSVPQAIETSTPPTPNIEVNSFGEKKPKAAGRFVLYSTTSAADLSDTIPVGANSGNTFIIEWISVSITTGAATTEFWTEIYNTADGSTVSILCPNIRVGANVVTTYFFPFPMGLKLLPGETINFEQDNVASSTASWVVCGHKRPYEKDIDNIKIQQVSA